MNNSFESASKGYRDALAAYDRDIQKLIVIEKRLIAKARESKTVEMLNTIEKQINGVRAGVPAVEQRFYAAADAIDESIVARFRALCAFATANRSDDAGSHYLLGECQAFEAAKGDFTKRKALYGSIITVVEALTAAPTKSERNIPAEKLRIYEQFMKMPDGEGKSTFYTENKAVICAVEDLKNLK